jgi:hypothetical protein
MLRSDATADASLAEIFDRNRLGMAIAARTRIMATTIRSSISEKPRCLRISPTLDKRSGLNLGGYEKGLQHNRNPCP